MSNSVFIDLLLPFSLALIMFGMGLGLTKQDFSRLWQTPKSVFVGLIGQLLLLPLLALLICILFELPAPLAVGLMILAASPGGTTSNVLSQLANANLALSVTLTSICTLVCVFSTPWIIHFSLQYFVSTGAPEFSLLGTSMGLILITLLPVLVGIWVRQTYSSFAIRYEVYFRRFSLGFMITMILALLIKEREMLVDAFQQVFWACMALSLGSILLGVLIAKVTKMSDKDAVTLGIEVGIQNATMSILIAISFLHEPTYAITASVYGLCMYLAPLPLIFWYKNKLKKGIAVSS
ncbi:bile acid:sodium symporter family protein [Psychrosphaera haliotis]|uniref:Bile acid:sodium symporter family protein n=1 Tax=Psychrosphaera haliotis TaxID=555083 RepID=A0A6N8F9L2_9GAMM|nr:bile acid:sodium symporter family protein [Psychrosphaera haliotis]MUH72958.1 bile acid:sodium symporter family protein [Psychrosphaera haliotis]